MLAAALPERSPELICHWLQLPADCWPPDHYSLLGLEPGESDPARIEQHVHERHERLIRYQLTHPEAVTIALNCLAQAFNCLTNPQAKQAYDVALLPQQFPASDTRWWVSSAATRHDPPKHSPVGRRTHRRHGRLRGIGASSSVFGTGARERTAPPYLAQGEPIPGYRLLEPVGRGGFGEVWKAEAPGGFLKAIKFVEGTIRRGGRNKEMLLQELTSLQAVKDIRHPYILSLDRFDFVDGRLAIVMELADCNLWDRFQQCAARGRPGMPRNELLRYLAEAAEALDLMNQRYRLQHSDIKPQNLFLVHNHVKIGDFGLVKDLAGLTTLSDGCFSPMYAAPELFQGTASRTSDQYSLAIVFQELLTGRRPFPECDARQMMEHHLRTQPDLSGLPARDQPIIRRALSKNPEARFATCEALIWALRNNDDSSTDAASTSVMRETTAAVETSKTVAVGLCRVRCPSCGYTGRLASRFKHLCIQCRRCRCKFVPESTQDPSSSPPTGAALSAGA